MARARVFKKIYREGLWGEKWSSGAGSFAESSYPYLALLQNFLKEKRIKTVVEIGCGDWELSRHIDWSGVDYLGIDVVPELIQRNRALYERAHIHFQSADAIRYPLPAADLILCKDVLQHLSNSDVALLLKKLEPAPYCLITNDVDPLSESSYNPDIETGGYRPIDITMPPFLYEGAKVLTYPSAHVVKQSLTLLPVSCCENRHRHRQDSQATQ